MKVQGNVYLAELEKLIESIILDLKNNKKNFHNFIPLKKRKYLLEAGKISKDYLNQEIEEVLLNLGISIKEVSIIIRNTKCYYSSYTIKQSFVKERVINEPCKVLKLLQRYILENIFYNLPNIKFNDCVTGFLKDKSIINNAEEHTDKKYLLKIDIKNFFPSITRYMIFKIFRYKLKFEYDKSYLYSKIVTCGDYLPQGGITSPFISNLCLLKLDDRLIKLIDKINENKINASYTRYADDLTFSFDKKIDFNRLKKLIYEIIYDEGFSPNYKKTKIIYKTHRQQVTGIIVNRDEISVSKKHRDYLRLIFSIWKNHGKEIAHKKYIEIFKKRNKNFDYQLISFISYCKMVNYRQGDKLEREYNAVKHLN